ncbi:MAG: hypothetical protein JSS02_16685 [Planctomycetes bacterium]|nr:hypothetical protein [Planctomycetota bacterium]
MSKKPLRLVQRDGFVMLDIGTMEIWDGADMALLRESLTRLIKVEKQRAIAVDMTYVKYIPSGFFGMMFDWYETGVRIRLYSPQPNVRKMLWFDQFFEPAVADGFDLAPRSVRFPQDFEVESDVISTSPRKGRKKIAAAAGH